MESKTVQEWARIAYDNLELAERDGLDAEDEGAYYVRTVAGAPEWMSDLCQNAHAHMLPDDWRYACIQSALESISDTDDGALEDAAHEWADAYCDTYTHKLTAWLASRNDRSEYCDQYIEETGDKVESILKLIECGQYNEAREVYSLVLGWLETSALIERQAGLDA